MKKIFSLVVSLCLIISSGTVAFASNSEKIDIDESDGYEIMKQDRDYMLKNWDKYQVNVDEKNSLSQQNIMKSSGGSRYKKGDIVTSFDSPTGHAALAISGTEIIESRPKSGVAIQPNNFNLIYNKVKGARVKDASRSEKNRAVSYARDQLGEPYNHNLLNKWKVNKWYCSQLVWRAYWEQGIDLEWDNSDIITPGDLIQTDKTEVIYSSF